MVQDTGFQSLFDVFLFLSLPLMSHDTDQGPDYSLLCFSQWDFLTTHSFCPSLETKSKMSFTI